MAATRQALTEPKPVFNPAFYARVSTHDQDTALQLREGRRWLEYMRLPKAAEYVDHGWSGAKRSRPDFDRLMKAALKGEHDLIVVWKLDRFGRSTQHLLESIDQLTKAGVRFVSITDHIDTNQNTPMGQLMLTILAALAQFERATIMERSAAGREVKFASGQPDSWNLVYGFEKGKPIVKEPEAEIIRHLFRWRDEEYSIYEIEERISKLALRLGAKPPRGEKWHARTMTYWLRNRQYACEYERCGEIYELPRIIDQDLFDRVNAKMETLYQRNIGSPKNKYLLTGILKSLCGEPMSGKSDHDLKYYRCNGMRPHSKMVEFTHCGCGHLRCDLIDEIVWGEIWRLLKDPERLRRMAEGFAREEEAQQPASGRDAREKLRLAKDKEQRIIDNYKDGDITREQKLSQLAQVREEMRGYEAEARAMGKVIEIHPRPVVEAACEALTKVREPKGPEDRREVLDGLLDLTAHLEGEDVVIRGKVPVGSAAKSNVSNASNGENRLDGFPDSLDPIPFVLRAKVAA